MTTRGTLPPGPRQMTHYPDAGHHVAMIEPAAEPADQSGGMMMILRASVGLVALAAVAFAVTPAASKGGDCSAKGTTAAVGGITKMADGPAREKAQGHMVGVNSSLAKGDMKGCAKHMGSAMKAMKS